MRQRYDKKADFPRQPPLVVKTKQQTGKELHQCTEENSDGHRHKDAHDDRKCLLGVHQVGRGEGARGIIEELDQRQGKGSSQQFEHHRYGGGGGHAQGIKDVEQHNVCHHDGQEDVHQFVEVELLGTEDAVAGNLHHAVAHRCATEHADGCNNDNGAKLGRLCADGGIEEIHRIVAHPDGEVEDSQYK